MAGHETERRGRREASNLPARAKSDEKLRSMISADISSVSEALMENLIKAFGEDLI
jgi:hypothetical protein